MLRQPPPAIHRYRVHGLTVETPFECPELMPSAGGEVDLRVREGVTPERLERATASGFKFEANPEHVLFKTDRVANLLVTGGTQVIVQRKDGASDAEVRFLLLGWGVGAALHQRGRLPLHASAIRFGDQAVIFCASSGTGKSSTAALFVQSGHRLLDDNIAAIARVDCVHVVFPGSPTLKLPADFVRGPEFSSSVKDRWQFVLGKHHVGVREDVGEQPLPLRKIYVLHRRGGPLRVVPLTGGARFDALVRNTFILRIVRGVDNLPHLFNTLFALAREVPMAELGLPEQLATREGLVEAVERDLAA